MIHRATKTSTISHSFKLLSFILLLSLSYTCKSQNQCPYDDVYYTHYGSDTTGKGSVVIDLPLYTLTNEMLKDSIDSAINRTKRNWDYDSIKNGYAFTLSFTINPEHDIDSVITVIVFPRTNTDLYVYFFNDLIYEKIHPNKTIGCFMHKGYLVLIRTFNRISKSAVLRHFESLDKTIELHTYIEKKEFYLGYRPFHHLSFPFPLH